MPSAVTSFGCSEIGRSGTPANASWVLHKRHAHTDASQMARDTSVRNRNGRSEERCVAEYPSPGLSAAAAPDRPRVAGCPAMIARLTERSARNLLLAFEKMPQGLERA